MKDDTKFIKTLYNKYLISSMLALFGGMIAQIANNIMIGNFIGEEALAVTSITMPIYYIFAVAGAMVGVGGATVCSKRIGKGDYEESQQIFTVTYILTAIVGVIITLAVLINLNGILSLFGISEGLYQNVYDYSLIMVVGGVFIMAIYPAFNFLRLDGQVKLSAVLFIVMAVINIVLDYVFLGIFELGIASVSLATGISMAVTTICGALLLFFKSKNFRLTRVNNFWSKTAEICSVGSPSAIENISILLRSVALNLIILSAFGTLTLSLFSILGSLNSLATIIIAGVSGSIVPLIGVFSTEKDIQSMKQVLKLAFLEGTALISLFSIVCIAFAPQISPWFGLKGNVLNSGLAITVFSASFVFAMLNNVIISLHMSNDRVRLANILTLLRSLVLPIALAYFLSNKFGLLGLWNSFWIVEAVVLSASIIISIVYHFYNKDLTIGTLIDEKPEKEGHYISFSVNNITADIVDCSEKISEYCLQNGLNAKRTMAISLALEELLISISEHSLKGFSGLKMNVRILIHNDVVVLRIRNGGKEFDPITHYKQRQTSIAEDELAALEQLDDSLGIKLILNITEVVDYQRTFGENNLTVIL